MFNRLIFICLASFFTQAIFAIQAEVDLSVFQAGESEYVELYIHLNSESIVYQDRENGLRAIVEVLILFEQEGHVVRADKYRLKSYQKKDFYDIKRYGLDSGTYQLRVEMTDIYDKEDQFNTVRSFRIKSRMETMAFSDITLLSKAEKQDGEGNAFKHGFLLEPLAGNVYHNKQNVLISYAEIYNSQLHFEGDFAICYRILDEENSDIGLISFKRYQKLSPTEIIPLILKLDIQNLKPGKYQFQIQILDPKANVVMTQSKYFIKFQLQPLDFILDLDEKGLDYALRSLSPLIHQEDTRLLNKMLKWGTVEEKQHFLKEYWSQAYPEETEKMYMLYSALLEEVHELFYSGFGYGFETDRGRIYVKYGKPNDIIRIEDDPIAFPYEIWTYENLPGNGQGNVKFLFYNEHLTGNGFRLLHSTAIGEYSNPRWEVVLYSNAPNEIEGENYHDATKVRDGFSRRARQLMEGGI